MKGQPGFQKWKYGFCFIFSGPRKVKTQQWFYLQSDLSGFHTEITAVNEAKKAEKLFQTPSY